MIIYFVSRFYTLIWQKEGSGEKGKQYSVTSESLFKKSF